MGKHTSKLARPGLRTLARIWRAVVFSSGLSGLSIGGWSAQVIGLQTSLVVAGGDSLSGGEAYEKEAWRGR